MESEKKSILEAQVLHFVTVNSLTSLRVSNLHICVERLPYNCTSIITVWQDVTVDDAHIKTIINLAARLERQNCDELFTVKKRRQQLNERSVSKHLHYIDYYITSLSKHLLSNLHFFALLIVPADRWSDFHGNLSSYKRKLKEALEVHSLIHDLEEVRDRASEKVRLLSFCQDHLSLLIKMILSVLFGP